ncbi:MAG: rhodanese-like domain-containing protein [Armatimonadetes bacterium]|nr:rhodanese-like domain-containing protein [Armatimonadota bacterium]
MAKTMAGSGLLKVDAATLREWLADDKCVLVDVREQREFDTVRIPGAILVPLSSFDPAKVPDPQGKHLVLHCQAGMRATDAARRLLKSGVETVWCFEGGMGEWTSAGFATEGSQGQAQSAEGASCCAPSARPAGGGLSVQRQTQLGIGIMMLVFTLLGQLIDERLGWLCLLPALGLINAGVTGLCPLATGIAKAPWNR